MHLKCTTSVQPKGGLQAVEAFHSVVVATGFEAVLGLAAGDVGDPEPLLSGEAALPTQVDEVLSQLAPGQVRE